MGWSIPITPFADFNRLASETCKGWWDVQGGVVLDGDKITTIVDQSNFNNHATQAASARQPDRVTFNGEQVADLAANKYFQADAVSSVFNVLDAPYTVFHLYLPDSIVGADKCLGGSGLNSSINEYFVSGYKTGAVIRSERKSGVTTTTVDGSTDFTNGGSETDLVLLTETTDGVVLRYWINTVLDSGLGGSGGPFSNPLNSQDKYTIGALRRGAVAASNFCDGKFRAQVVCDRELSLPEREWVENAIVERRFSWN